MKAHFEYSGLTQPELIAFLREKKIRGTWYDWDLNVFQLLPAYTDEDFDRLADLCKTEFFINGVRVRANLICPPPPKLERGE